MFCKSWWFHDQRLLRAAILLFVPGVVKCLEKPLALQNATVNSIANSSDPRMEMSLEEDDGTLPTAMDLLEEFFTVAKRPTTVSAPPSPGCAAPPHWSSSRPASSLTPADLERRGATRVLAGAARILADGILGDGGCRRSRWRGADLCCRSSSTCATHIHACFGPAGGRHDAGLLRGLAGDLDRARAQVAKRGGCAGGGRRGQRGVDGRRAEDGRRGEVRAALEGGATPRPWIEMASTTTRRPWRPRSKGRLVRGGRAVGAASG